jgi:hypothetical protein
MNTKVKQVIGSGNVPLIWSIFLKPMPPAIRVLFATLVGTLISGIALYIELPKHIGITTGMVVIGIVMALTHSDETPASTP